MSSLSLFAGKKSTEMQSAPCNIWLQQGAKAWFAWTKSRSHLHPEAGEHQAPESSLCFELTCVLLLLVQPATIPDPGPAQRQQADERSLAKQQFTKRWVSPSSASLPISCQGLSSTCTQTYVTARKVTRAYFYSGNRANSKAPAHGPHHHQPAEV